MRFQLHAPSLWPSSPIYIKPVDKLDKKLLLSNRGTFFLVPEVRGSAVSFIMTRSFISTTVLGRRYSMTMFNSL